MIVKELLTRGYFPKELPHPFSSIQLEKINDPIIYQQIDNSSSSSLLFPVSISKIGYSRRELNIPNPLAQIKLVLEIQNSFSSIYQHINKSTLSKSRPFYSNKGRSFRPRYWHGDLLDFKAEIFSRSRYVLRTDIQQFYPKLYTHSIPWALHTKPVAKRQRTNSQLLGNRLDKLIRQGQDGQTIGIPIGPDTSLFIAEILLSSIDEDLQNKFPNLTGFRFVDDYYFGFKNYQEMEQLLAVLKTKLRDFELSINYDKTDLSETPLSLQPEWVHKIKDIDFRETNTGFRSDLIHLFDTVFYLAKEYPNDSIHKFGLSILGYQNCSTGNWYLLQSLLNQVMKGEPSTIPQVFNNYLKYKNLGYQVDLASLSDTLFEIIKWQSTMGNYYEVAYSLWFLIYFNIDIPSNVVKILEKIENSLIALLTLDAKSKTLIQNLNKTVWQQIVDDSLELYGKNWLLAYEAVKKGWLIPTRTNHVNQDPFFSILMKNDVEFYDSNSLISRLKPILLSVSNPSTPHISLISL